MDGTSGDEAKSDSSLPLPTSVAIGLLVTGAGGLDSAVLQYLPLFALAPHWTA